MKVILKIIFLIFLFAGSFFLSFKLRLIDMNSMKNDKIMANEKNISDLLNQEVQYIDSNLGKIFDKYENQAIILLNLISNTRGIKERIRILDLFKNSSKNGGINYMDYSSGNIYSSSGGDPLYTKWYPFFIRKESGYTSHFQNRETDRSFISYVLIGGGVAIAMDFPISEIIENVNQSRTHSDYLMIIDQFGTIILDKYRKNINENIKYLYPDFLSFFNSYIKESYSTPRLGKIRIGLNQNLVSLKKIGLTPLYLIAVKDYYSGVIGPAEFNNNEVYRFAFFSASVLTFLGFILMLILQNAYRKKDSVKAAYKIEKIIIYAFQKIRKGEYGYRINPDIMNKISEEILDLPHIEVLVSLIEEINHFFGHLQRNDLEVRKILHVLQLEKENSNSMYENLEQTYSVAVNSVNMIFRSIGSLKETMIILSIKSEKSGKFLLSIIRKIQDEMSLFTKINARSKTMERMSKIIEDLNHEIQMIGINTAIEASKSGAQAKGFNVIAMTIQELGVETDEKNEEIKKSILEIREYFSNFYNMITQIRNQMDGLKQLIEEQEKEVQKMNLFINTISNYSIDLSEHINERKNG